MRTETQFFRPIDVSQLQMELILLGIDTHKVKNTSYDHLITFYQASEELNDRKFEGFIITDAPVELLPLE